MLGAGDLVIGLAVLLPLLTACGVAGWGIAERLAPDAPLPAAALAGSAVLVFAHLLPGAVGLLRPLVVLAVAVGAALALRPRRRLRLPRLPRPAFFAAAVCLLVAGCALALVRELAGAPLSSIDALNFQVPIPARWIQQHDVWGLHQFIADYSNATYPHHGNVLLAAVMLPFDSPFLARLVAVPFWAAAGWAVYGIARELDAPRPPAALAGAAFVALPIAITSGLPGAHTDMPMLAWLGAGVFFLLRGNVPLAGLGLGLALGTKWYALPAVGAIVVIWALAHRREVPRLVGVIALAGGFWFVRNWIETGNPLFPQELPPLFDAPPDPLRERAGFTIAHYAFDADVWRTYLWPAFKHAFGLGGAILAAGAVAAAWIGRRDRRVLLVAAAAAVLAVVYVFTPYSAFGPEGRPVTAVASTRYALPALMACAVVAARLPWAQPLLALAALDGLRRGFDLPLVEIAVGVAAAAVVLLAARRPRLLAVGAAAAVVLLAVVSRERANTQRYGQFDPALAWLDEHATEQRRIGLAGVWSPAGVSPVLPAFGPRLDNHVEYVGEFRDGMLRAHDDVDAFGAALRRLDVLVVGRAGSAREMAWARTLGWRPAAESPRLAVLVPGVSSAR